MSELLDALENREFVDAVFVVGEKSIPLKVRVFSEEDFKAEIDALKNGDKNQNAERLAGYFYDAKALTPIFTAEKLLSSKIKNRDVAALCRLFADCNRGLEGN